MVETLTNLLDELRASHALEPAQLEVVERELLPRLSAPRPLAKELLARGWLTQLQIQYAFHGKGKELYFDPYVLLERLGEGGMGQVFKARHAKLGRVVALKVVRQDENGDTRAVERFKREITAVAKLKHPNVVMAYDADRAGDALYYVMEYVDGSDLTKLVREKGPLGVRQACECTRQAALALQHAHEQGLVHRDVKPSNLLLTADGSTVKLLDLGLARIRAGGPGGQDVTAVTQINTFIGTPDFVAPEQAINSRDVDIRADLYSLGCTLYYLLTGQPPFTGESTMDKLIKHRVEEPIRVETIRPDVPRGVAAILRKLMAKKPEQRYQSPSELADALEPFCREGVRAVTASPPPQKRPKAKRMADPALPPRLPPRIDDGTVEQTPAPTHPTPGRLRHRQPRSRREWIRWSVVGGVSALLFGMVLLVLANLATPRSPAQTPADDSRLPLAGKPEPKRPTPTLSVLDQLNPARLPEDAREAWRVSGRELPPELVHVVGSHSWRHWGSVRSVDVDADERRVASAGDDGVIRIWRLDDSQLLQALAADGGTAWAVAFSHDGKLLGSATEDGYVRVWDTQSWERTHTLEGHQGPVRSLAFSPGNSTMLASGGADGTVRTWNLSDGRPAQTLNPKAGIVRCLAFSSNGRSLAAGTDEGRVKVWEIDGFKETLSADSRSKSPITGLSFGPNEKAVVSADLDGRVLLWVHDRALPRLLSDQGGPALSLASVQGPRRMESGFITGRASGELRVMKPDRRPMAPLFMSYTSQSLTGHLAGVTALSIGGRGRTLVSGDDFGVLRVWELENGQERFRTTGAQGPIRAVAFGAEGKMLGYAGVDRIARVLDLGSRKDVEYRGHTGALTGLHLQQQMATTSDDKSLRLWNVESWQEKKQCIGHEHAVLSLAGTADGRLLASGDTAGLILLWDGVTGNQLVRLAKHEDKVTTLAFSPDGKLLLSGCWNGELILWNVESREARATVRINAYEVLSVAFAPDGRTFASAGADGAIHFWETDSGTPFNNLELEAPVQSVRYTPDGKRLAFATRHGLVGVWEFGLRRRITEWRFPGPVYDLAFAPDGRHLATANANGTVYVLRLPVTPSR